MSRPVLRMIGIEKTFPGVKALDKVNLEVWPGEVVALIGENGAGKSTLMNILGGVLQPDGGIIEVDGEEVEITDVQTATRLGIGFIHQELNVLDNLSVAANVFLGREPFKWKLLRIIDRKKLNEMTEPYLRRLGLEVDADTLVSELSIAQRQLVEIAKALSLDARILIMDEPTSSLTLSETRRLFEVIRQLRDEGVSVIYISHRLAEVGECADRVVGLRDGKNAGSLTKEQINHNNMIRLMIGRDLEDFFVSTAGVSKEPFFRVEGFVTEAYPYEEISFEAAKGEILGFAGLVGAGRTELAETIFGIRRKIAGQVYLGGRKIEIRSARDAIDCGIYLVPEDRRNCGLVTEMSVCENITLAKLERFADFGMVRRGRENELAHRQVMSLGIKTPSIRSIVKNLSGGNQQKVVLAKWLAMKPSVIIFDEPTRGIDVAAKAEIYRLMRGLADNGVVVIMISSDMEEILGLSDRVAVMCQGRISGILRRDELNEELVMRMAVGMVSDRQR